MNHTSLRSRTRSKFLSIIAAIAALGLSSANARAQEDAVGRTPPRLSYIDGQASFWRPGADDWSQAEINLPLAPGDQLYTSERTNVELQVGARAFVRAAENTQFGLENQEPDYLQFRLTGGQLALDLRDLDPGHTVELATPHAAFTIERTGYYRAVVGEDATTFIVRRGGSAVAIPAGGPGAVIGNNQQAVIRGFDNPTLETYAATELDPWDNWNYARTDSFHASASAQYIPDDVYAAHELDTYGTWRTVPTYGSVWVPRAVPTGWAPYSDGRWIWDPYYGWSWVSYEPWGWAPYHYGRWVHYDNYWAWAPGPRVSVGVYAPALVAFFGDDHFRVGIGIGAPIAPVGWVSLSWGEPLYPWWGSVGFRDHPYWGGWGGPRVVINKTKIVNKTKVIHIDGYRNSRHRDGVVIVKGDRFGRDDVRSARLDRYDRNNLRPIYSKENVRPTRESLRVREARGKRPPRELSDRRVVATREPRDTAPRLREAGLNADTRAESRRVRLVDSSQRRLARTTQPDAGRSDSGDRRRSIERDNRGSRATVPNPHSERPRVQSPPNRQRPEERRREDAVVPAPRSRTEPQQPGVERQRRQSAPEPRERGVVPRRSDPRSSPPQPRIERQREPDARRIAPPAPRSERQPDRRVRESAPPAPAPRSRVEQRPQRESHRAAPPAPRQRVEQRSQRREETTAPRQEPRQRVEPQRQSRPARQPRPQSLSPQPSRQERAAPRQRVEPRRETRPQSFSAPQARPQRQERVQRSQPQRQERAQRSQPQTARPQRAEQPRANRQVERSSRGGSESRQSRGNSRGDRNEN
jgi:hypothetical protein